ncbi:hypothetical protein HAX54_017616 [Datura stramonium]|uniref:PTC1-like winged helix-turn-helix domain-containing protein n=1 Tax=Datura stramonium TaxID=4076 RepID=A0ABS8UMM3_DATST|nr:hypothetical protein [Datura stramonium]
MGPFRDNIRYFLQECAELEEYTVEGMPIWSTFGWSHHFVSKRKYHLIIPADCEWNKHLEDGVFDDQTHVLHGLIHSNGFGHLISINGIEIEISVWPEVMTCGSKITVEDVSKKYSMDLVFVVYWLWPYVVIDDFRYTSRSNVMKQMIVCYRVKEKPNVAPVARACSSRYLMRNAAPPNKSAGKEKSVRYRKFSNVAASLDSRWPVRRLEFTADVIVDALREKRAANRFGSCGMRAEARDAARLHIGDRIDWIMC